MNELELKYGCNPNQKPARVFMKTAQPFPLRFSTASPATSTCSTPSTRGSSCAN